MSEMNTMADTGILALEDGSVFSGISFGATKTVVGVAVFSTGMTGYKKSSPIPLTMAKL